MTPDTGQSKEIDLYEIYNKAVKSSVANVETHDDQWSIAHHPLNVLW